MKRRHSILPFALAAACAVPSAASAAIRVDIAQSGGNVVATLSGSLNTTGLTVLQTIFGLSAAIQPSRGYIGLGTSPLTNGYTGFTGPFVFGPGTTFTNATSSSGDGFGLDAIMGAQTLFLPQNYASGTQLSGSSIFANTTLAALALTPGQYVFRTPADTITITIGSFLTAVPEPAAWSLMLVGFGLVGAALRSRRRVAVSYA